MSPRSRLRALGALLPLLTLTVLATACTNYDAPPMPGSPPTDSAESVASGLIQYNADYAFWRVRKQASLYDVAQRHHDAHDRFYYSPGKDEEARRLLLAKRRDLWSAEQEKLTKLEAIEVEETTTDEDTGYVTVRMRVRTNVMVESLDEEPNDDGEREMSVRVVPVQYRFNVKCVKLAEAWKVVSVNEIRPEDRERNVPPGWLFSRFTSLSADTFVTPVPVEPQDDHKSPAAIAESYGRYLVASASDWKLRVEAAEAYADHLERVAEWFADPTSLLDRAAQYRALKAVYDVHRDELEKVDVRAVDAYKRDKKSFVTVKLRTSSLRWSEADVAWKLSIGWSSQTWRTTVTEDGRAFLDPDDPEEEQPEPQPD